ncbi:oxidation resistance protein 1 [Tulasnella sp. 332]|nr:oxidation resistance protein 1 [Tulasnella sp. 332]
MTNPPSGLQFDPLIPLPSQSHLSHQENHNDPRRQQGGSDATSVTQSSPFTSLFNVPAAHPSETLASSTSTSTYDYDPLFFSKSPPRVNLKTQLQQPAAIPHVTHDHQLSPTAAMTMEPSPATPSSAGGFGDFVDIDPLSQTASFSPLSSPTRSTKTSSPIISKATSRNRIGSGAKGEDDWNLGGAFSNTAGNATVRFSNSKVARELERAGQNEDDPLGWLSEVPRDKGVAKGGGGGGGIITPFDNWDGMGDELESSAAEEIAYHAKGPKTPRASRSASPVKGLEEFHKGDPYRVDKDDDSDDDIIDLVTGRRERYHHPPKGVNTKQPLKPVTSPSSSNPISIASPSSSSLSSHRPAHEQHHIKGSASYFNTFTLPRTWFSAASASPPVTTHSPPKNGLTRQNSQGEFSDLPSPDLKPYHLYHDHSPTKKNSPRFGLAGVFEHPSTLLESVVPAAVTSNPMAKKVFIPPTGAPGFRPDENWNPEGFVYDSHSKKDTLGREKLLLIGRNENATPVLSQGVADAIRLQLPPLPRLAQSWRLLYSTDQHGISISTLYKNVDKTYGLGGGCVLAVQEVLAHSNNSTDELTQEDAAGEGWGKPCFGIWIGSGIRCQEGAYYGSGESFLWKTTKSSKGKANADGVKVFKWTARNDYVALCESDYLSFGGGDGKYGLYVDSSFTDGLSEPSETFANEVLCEDVDVNGRGRFECVVLEVWQVGA